MLSLKFRRNLLIVLFVLSIILIVLTIFLKTDSNSTGTENEFVNHQEIKQRFINTLYEFGIEEALIKEKKIIDKTSDDDIVNFKIQVPKDLSIPEILLGINQTFREDSLQISSFERKKGGKSELELKHDRSIILRAEFNYSKNVLRNRGAIGFIIKDINPAELSSNNLIQSSTKLNFLLRPGSETLHSLESIYENGNQFSLLIDDEISEQKYKLNAAHSEKRIITVLKTLVTDFANAVSFIIDDNSEFYNSPNRELFTTELRKRGIRISKISDFVKLALEQNPIDTFNQHIVNLKHGEKSIFILDEETFNVIHPEIIKSLKLGFRIVNTSLLFD